jgi:hypothetical protein
MRSVCDRSAGSSAPAFHGTGGTSGPASRSNENALQAGDRIQPARGLDIVWLEVVGQADAVLATTTIG